MRTSDYVRARTMQWLAPVTVSYGKPLRFAGTDLPRPTRLRVPTRHGPVPVHVYRPVGALRSPAPVHVHFHGGAFLMRYPKMDDWWCRYVAAEAGVVVVNVDFSVAPQVAYPVAQEQCHDVAAWVAAQGSGLGPGLGPVLEVDGTRVSVGGFSSGGGLAASVALQARDLGSFRPVLQVLGIPALDLSAEPRPGDPGMISPDLRALVRRVYFPDATTRAEPYASPLLAEDLTGLPPAVVLTAEHDVLRAEGDAYAARLADAGVPVLHDTTPGVDHYFLTQDPQRARMTMGWVAAEIRHRCR